LGITGSSEVGVQLLQIYVSLSFLEGTPPGSIPRKYLGKVPDDKLVSEYMDQYKGKPIEVDKLFADLPANSILILGMPGAGKTTMLKYQAIKYFDSFCNPTEEDGKLYLPVFIQLREFTEYKRDMLSRISEYLKDKTGEPFDNDFLNLYLKSGQIALFYDGLDEIADIAQRNKMVEDIVDFAGDHPNDLHVITCRIAAYPEINVDMSSFTKYTIDDMNKDQRDKFIRGWYSARSSMWDEREANEMAERLIKKIDNTPSILRLAVNPLLLTIMAIIYGDLRNIPETRLELYEECVKVLMEKRDKARGIKSVMDEFKGKTPQPPFILGELAYGLHRDSESLSSGLAEPKRDEILNRISEIIINRRKVEDDEKKDEIKTTESPDFLRIIQERTSILVDKGMGRSGFIHQTFQEYFTAYYLNAISEEKMWYGIKDKIWNQYWGEVLLLLSEMLARRVDVLDNLLKKIIEDGKSAKESSHLLLLADIIIQGTSVTDTFKSEVFNRIYEKCVTGGEFFGDYIDRIEKLKPKKDIYNLLEKEIKGESGVISESR
jgi:predicted NACHT family NTPase